MKQRRHVITQDIGNVFITKGVFTCLHIRGYAVGHMVPACGENGAFVPQADIAAESRYKPLRIPLWER